MNRPLEGGGCCRLLLLRFRSLNLPWMTQPWIPSARPRQHRSPFPAINNKNSFRPQTDSKSTNGHCHSQTRKSAHPVVQVNPGQATFFTCCACNSVYLGFLDFLLTKLRVFAGLARVRLFLGVHGSSPSYFIVVASRICGCIVMESSCQVPLHRCNRPHGWFFIYVYIKVIIIVHWCSNSEQLYSRLACEYNRRPCANCRK